MKNVWACPGGITAAALVGRPLGLRFRDAFLGTVAAGALSLAFSGPALAGLPAGCSLDATFTIETCVGNQSAGIAIINPVMLTTLDVNNLTQAITPASGTDGIIFTSAGAVTITSNTGAFGITTVGDFAFGIRAGFGGGAVTVTSTGNISTGGTGAGGIVAYSASTVTVTSTGNISTAGEIGFGIKASSFGGGAVTVTSTGSITTAGIYGFGILADSTAGAVTVTSIGNITTGNAFGILANTYGSGAVTVTSTGNISTAGSKAYGIEAGGFGGSAVTVTSTGNISTAGTSASGIFALSTGTGAVTVTSTGNISTAGISANGINAYSQGTGAVTVTSTGNISTAGISANGINAYSQGAGAVAVTSTGNISTAGNAAIGIFAYSQGAGAVAVSSTGNITTVGDFAFGIRAGFGGGAVTVTSTGNISTGGTGAGGIVAYSASTVTVTSTGNISTAGEIGFGIKASSFGGGAVTVTSTGSITTAGIYGFGILADSTAGAVTVTSIGNITTGNAFGIIANTYGSGAVTVTSTGNISTAGSKAYGIEAGGFGGSAVTVTSTGNISTAGTSASGIFALSTGTGAVTVASTGNISTAGISANGINAYSQGAGAVAVSSTGNISTAGNAAIGIFAGGNGPSAVTVTSAGNISAAGNNAIGIFAESSGPIAITIKSGTVSGGSGTGAGVALLCGTNNTLTNMGTVTALSGLAIQGTTGNDTVNNSGAVIGNVILGSGTNAFNNMAGGLFNSGATVNLGAGNALTNAGTLSPGGAGVIQTTALTGNLAQNATGRLFSDINIAGASSDRVNVSGTANLAGAVQVQVQNAILGPWQQTVLSAAGGTTNNGLALLASPALQAQLVFPNATDVVVKSTGINFLTPGLNNNQSSLANAFNGAAQTAGLGGPVFNFLLNGVTSVPGYNLALNQLSGEAATGTQQTTFDAMNTFMGTMLDPFNRGTTSMPGGSVSGYASEGDASAYASDGRKRTAAERDAYAMFTKAPPASLRGALERVGGRFWRLADHRWQCGAGFEQHNQQHRRHGGRRRLSLLAVHDCRVCAGRRRHQLQRRG